MRKITRLRHESLRSLSGTAVAYSTDFVIGPQRIASLGDKVNLVGSELT